MRTLLIALVLIASVAAQPGPAPGYGDPYAYALDYGTEQASEATADPVAFVGNHSTQEALVEEGRHGAYMACWTADHNGVEHEVCDPYYSAAGEVGPQNQPEPDPTPEEVDNATAEAEEAVEEFAENATEAVEEFLEDPTNVTGFLDQVVGAVTAFVEDLIEVISGVGTFATDAVLAAAQGVVMLIGGLGLGLGMLGTATSVGISTGLMAIGTGTIEGAQAVAGGIKAAGSAIGSGIVAVASGTVAAVSAVASGIAAAAGALVDGVQAMGQALADAATSLKDTVSGWFGGEPSVSDLGHDVKEAVPVDDKGLVDGVLDLVE
ncbi:MAG: hypothetical protein ACPHK8_02910 [Thermoplasmatota archaeon]